MCYVSRRLAQETHNWVLLWVLTCTKPFRHSSSLFSKLSQLGMLGYASLCCNVPAAFTVLWPHANLPCLNLWPNQRMPFHAVVLFFFTGAMKSKTSLAVSLGWGKFSPLRSSQDCQLSLTKHDVFLHLPTLLLVYHSWNGFLFSRERRWHNCIDVSVDSYLPKKNHQETRGSVRAKSQLPPSSSMSLALSQDYFCFATP